MLDTDGATIASPGQVVGCRRGGRCCWSPPWRSAGADGSRATSPPAGAHVPWLVGLRRRRRSAPRSLYGPSPLGTDALIATYAGAAGSSSGGSRARPAWCARHVAALATGWLTAFAVGAFATDPIGHVTRRREARPQRRAAGLVAAVGPSPSGVPLSGDARALAWPGDLLTPSSTAPSTPSSSSPPVPRPGPAPATAATPCGRPGRAGARRTGRRSRSGSASRRRSTCHDGGAHRRRCSWRRYDGREVARATRADHEPGAGAARSTRRRRAPPRRRTPG